MTCPTVSSMAIATSRRRDDCLGQRRAVQDVVAVDLETAQQLAERVLGAQRLDLVDLRRERQGMARPGEDHPLTCCESGSGPGGEQIGHVYGEAVDHAETAIPEDRGAIARQ